MRLSLGTAVLAVIALVASACGSSHVKAGPAAAVSESRLIEGGTVRCTATVLTTPVQAGHKLGTARVAFTFHNLTNRKIFVMEQEGSAIVRSPDGTTYDPLWEIEHSPGDIVGATPLAPGGTTEQSVLLPRVAWEGPLRITPSCGNSTLRPIRVAVTSPGLPASARAAVTDVVAATGHLLDHCRPRMPGVSVVGRIEPVSGNLPPFGARCSVSLRRERGFYVAQMLVVTPPDLRGMRIVTPYEQLRGLDDVRNRNAQQIAWEFVVTRRGANSIQSAVGESSTRHWDWISPGQSQVPDAWCGGSGGALGETRPQVGFLSSDCRPWKT